MTTLDHETERVLQNLDDGEARIRAICFKTGPPEFVGAEMEWTVHHAAAPGAPLSAEALRQALGPHAPETLVPGSPELPLPGGSPVTLEPGGQVEISSAPATSVAALHAAVTADLDRLTARLAAAGLTLGAHGMDPFREPHRMLRTPRYERMEQALDEYGPHGRLMMCCSAGLQVCVDAGTESQLPARWAAVWAFGPPLLAAFANSRRVAGRDTGLASARMATWWRMDPRTTHPVRAGAPDLAEGWVRYVLEAPVLAVDRDAGRWSAPPGLTMRDWLGGALESRPTVSDLDYHISTLFPPVRPRGYLEIRYLDEQPSTDWIVPVAVVSALLADDTTTDRALSLAEPTTQRWIQAFQLGLADPPLYRTAAGLLDLACRNLDRIGLPRAVREHVTDTVDRRLRAAGH